MESYSCELNTPLEKKSLPEWTESLPTDKWKSRQFSLKGKVTLQHRYTPVGFEDEHLTPREAQSQTEVHSLERPLHRVVFFCSVTHAVLNSAGMNDVGLPQGITAQFSPCAIEAVRGWRARQCVSVPENRLEETPKEHGGHLQAVRLLASFIFFVILYICPIFL